MDKERVKKEAKKIMDDFLKALGSIKLAEGGVEREEFEREEGDGEEADSFFREQFLKNAPKVKEDCIESEKGDWV
ncbi:MAG: hypothetical protein ABIE22_03420 [archaeon]